MKKLNTFLLLSSSALILAACGDTQTEKTPTPTDEDQTEVSEPVQEETGSESTEMLEVESVTVDMLNNDGDQVGTAVFEETLEGGVTLNLNLEGLPAGEYGMHIHEVGSATAPTFEDAGSHFNPTEAEHGVNSESGPHVGDLPNLIVSEDGVVDLMIDIPNTSLQLDGENTLNSENGTSLIVHTDEDDYESQPTGDAGDRMLGGVIFSGTAE